MKSLKLDMAAMRDSLSLVTEELEVQMAIVKEYRRSEYAVNC